MLLSLTMQHKQNNNIENVNLLIITQGDVSWNNARYIIFYKRRALSVQCSNTIMH